MNKIPNTLLIDFRRFFVDGRETLIARNSKDAVAYLSKNEPYIKVIWMDYRMGPADNIDIVLSFLALRSKVGMKYPVNMINVHAPDEAGWQVLSTKLKNAGYSVRRETIRDQLE